MLDLEQYLGKEITWVSGITFDQVVNTKGGWLPNKLHRYCTQYLKLEPMFEWWRKNINEPVIMNLGFRANEYERANRMLEKCNANGFLEQKTVISKTQNGRNKWGMIEWQKPEFPLIRDNIYRDSIKNYWSDKNVRFAEHNNCVGCFHRNPAFLRYMYQEHPQKMNWFEKQEGGKKGYWKTVNGQVIKYERIRKMMPQATLFDKDFTPCDAGYCGF